jgi:hypothetical protein
MRQPLDERAPIADVSRETIVICGSRSRPDVSRETISTEKIDEFETQCWLENRGDGIIGGPCLFADAESTENAF